MSEEKKQLPKATYTGVVKIGDFEIRAYNLDTGERVLSREGFLRVMGRTGKPKYKEELTDGGENQVFKTPLFLSANNLKPFISTDLIASSQPIVFEMASGQKAYGYKAEILPSVCYVFIDAEKNKALNKTQEAIAQRCEILVRGFATIGIIALVDEATGYQFEREKDELQKILSKYISPELLPWQKRFPDEFYKEIFRLKTWDFTLNGIKKRPGIIGSWTKMLIYNLLPKGVLQELENKTPKSAAGNKTARLHQSLTIDIGEPHLEKQLLSIITLMNVSDNWEQFLGLFAKKYGQTALILPSSKPNKVNGKSLGQISLFSEDEPENEKELIISKDPTFGNVLGAVARAGKPDKE